MEMNVGNTEKEESVKLHGRLDIGIRGEENVESKFFKDF